MLMCVSEKMREFYDFKRTASPFARRPYGQSPYGQPKPSVQEDTLKSEEIQIERKAFVFTLKENPRGPILTHQ